MTSSTATNSQPPKGLARVVSASMAGTVVEWYEFFLYATAATLVFGTEFFPKTGDPLDGVIAAMLTYAVGFIARPLGGIVFGHFGDRFGRKKLLQFSLILVGASTFLMGTLPTFHAVGYLAPVLLVILRFIQGFAVGGEWGGAVLLVAEHSPDRRRAFWSSFPQAAVPIGNLLATGVLILLNSVLDDAQFLSWGWRIGFFLSAIVVLVGWYIRKSVEDAPIFQAAVAKEEQAKKSRPAAIEVFRAYPRQVLTAMGMRVIENIWYYIVVTFTITYLKDHLEMATDRILLLLLVAHAVQMFAIPTFGMIADRIGRRPVYLLGVISAGVFGFLMYPMYDTKNELIIVLAVTIGLVIHAIMFAPIPAIMSEMFPTRIRYTGVSIGYQVTAIFAGSLAPVIATTLLRDTGTSLSISWYILGAAVISLVATLFARETKGLSLTQLDRQDSERREPTPTGS